MKSLEIAGLSFEIINLGEGKTLFQKRHANIEEQLSVPVIGEHIQKLPNDTIINVVAAENELLIYHKEQEVENLFTLLNGIQFDHINLDYDKFVIEVCFELGLDWSVVEAKTNKNKEEVIKLILDNDYPLINFGFQPGFMYLDHLDEVLQIERKENPRIKVPAGSIAIGGKYIGIYGSESPGGWNIIGRTSQRNQKNGKFAKLASIGQEIKFHRIDEDQYLRKYEDEA